MELGSSISAAYGYDVRAELVGEAGSIAMNNVADNRTDMKLASSTRYDTDWRRRYHDAYVRQNCDFLRFAKTEIFPDIASDCWDGSLRQRQARRCARRLPRCIYIVTPFEKHLTMNKVGLLGEGRFTFDLITSVGDEHMGRCIVEQLKREGVDGQMMRAILAVLSMSVFAAPVWASDVGLLAQHGAQIACPPHCYAAELVVLDITIRSIEQHESALGGGVGLEFLIEKNGEFGLQTHDDLIDIDETIGSLLERIAPYLIETPGETIVGVNTIAAVRHSFRPKKSVLRPSWLNSLIPLLSFSPQTGHRQSGGSNLSNTS